MSLTLDLLPEDAPKLRWAELSADRRFRYELGRRWRPTGRTVLFVGLNPSTADEDIDDPTIRRCIGFARTWGFSGLHMTNLFAFRATDPQEMMRATEPIGGPDNDKTITRLAAASSLVIACWGVHGAFLGRDVAIRALVPGMKHLGLTKGGQPRHPLYLPGDTVPKDWVSSDAC